MKLARSVRWRATGWDLLVVAATVILVLAAALRGRWLLAAGVDIYLDFPPLLATWLPHVGPGTGPAIVLAGLIVWAGPGLATRLRWPLLLLTGWLAAVAWTTSLALIDGYSRGIAGRLTTTDEYLHDVGRVTDIPAMLRGFSAHILTDHPGFWTTHVGAHPPGAFLVFVWLARCGLGGGGPAGFFCILVGSSAVVAIAVTVRAVAEESVARAALPFAVLFPGAVWVGVSADGMFTGVLAWAVALLAFGLSARGWRADVAALVGGVLSGYTLYLSYGLLLGALLGVAVIASTKRRARALLLAGLGVASVVAAFTVSGFWWPTGLSLTRIIYAESIAKTRPYAYFWWANLAAVSFALGPAALAGLRRIVRHPRVPAYPVTLLVAAALLAILLADASGMSKAEVERIWLPFAIWLTTAATALPAAQRRPWLAAQAVLALTVNHLLLTVW